MSACFAQSHDYDVFRFVAFQQVTPLLLLCFHWMKIVDEHCSGSPQAARTKKPILVYLHPDHNWRDKAQTQNMQLWHLVACRH